MKSFISSRNRIKFYQESLEIYLAAVERIQDELVGKERVGDHLRVHPKIGNK